MATPHNDASVSPRLIGAKRVPDVYGIRYTSLRDLVHKGEIPCVRIGRAMYLERRDLDQWIKTRKTRA